MKGKLFLFVLLGVLATFSCRNASIKSEKSLNQDPDSSTSALTGNSDKALNEILRNYSSPVEIANLFQMMQVPFSPENLASSIDPDAQSTSFRKAISLGILGADLAYLNMYEKTGSSNDVLESIRKLADGLNVAQFFDFEAITRLSQNKSSLDSLLLLSKESFSRIDEYLRENDRGQYSSLIVTGIWIESQYMATRVMKQYPGVRLRERIGEQKYFLDNLIKLSEPYCNQDEKFSELCRDLKDIKGKYDAVKITYTPGDPVKTEKEGGLLITQTETSNVDMSDKQLEDIIEITGKIRNKLIVNE